MAIAELLQAWTDGWRAVWGFAPGELRWAVYAWGEMSAFQRAMLCLGALAVWFLFRITRLLGARVAGRL